MSGETSNAKGLKIKKAIPMGQNMIASSGYSAFRTFTFIINAAKTTPYSNPAIMPII